MSRPCCRRIRGGRLFRLELRRVHRPHLSRYAGLCGPEGLPALRGRGHAGAVPAPILPEQYAQFKAQGFFMLDMEGYVRPLKITQGFLDDLASPAA